MLRFQGSPRLNIEISWSMCIAVIGNGSLVLHGCPVYLQIWQAVLFAFAKAPGIKFLGMDVIRKQYNNPSGCVYHGMYILTQLLLAGSVGEVLANNVTSWKQYIDIKNNKGMCCTVLQWLDNLHWTTFLPYCLV